MMKSKNQIRVIVCIALKKHYPGDVLISKCSYRADLDAVRAGIELSKGKIQAHPYTAAHPEGSVKGLGKVSVEGVKVCHTVCHTVEGQSP